MSAWDSDESAASAVNRPSRRGIHWDSLDLVSQTVTKTTKNLNCKFITPLGSDQMLIGFRGIEEISRPYEIEVIFTSKNNKIDFSKLLGKQASVELFSQEKKKQYLTGILKAVAQGRTFKDESSHMTEYRVVMVPSLYKLCLAKSYVFYQNKTALDIIKGVLKKNGISNVSYSVSKLAKTKRETCIQYNETDLFFITRLMEEEGLFYFFKHEKGKETLVIADNNKAFVDSKEKVCITSEAAYKKHEEMVHRTSAFVVSESMWSKEFLADSYDYEKPNTKLLNKKKNSDSKNTYGSVYTYDEFFTDNSAGKTKTSTRMESIEYKKNLSYIQSDVPLNVGEKFALKDHVRQNFNANYVVTKIAHNFDVRQEPAYTNSITIFDESKGPYRPDYVLEKPRIFGYLSAVVTGQDKQDVFRDALARVKVRFLWDLDGVKNKEKSSGWIRVAQTFAGSGFGAIFLPRVGQEVVVTFLNGDPDCPLVIGALYNGNNKPPYADADISCIKTQTFGDKKGFNEIKLTDKKKKEEFYVRAQKDYVMLVNENSTITLKKGNYTLTLEEGNVKVEVKGKIDVHSTDNISVDCDKDISISAKGKIALTAKKDIIEDATGNITMTSKKNISGTAQSNIDLKAKTGKFSVDCTGAASVTSKNNIKLDAKMGMTLNCNMKMALTGKAGFDASTSAAMSLKCNLAMTVEAKLNMSLKSNLNMSVKSSVNMELSSTIMNIKSNAINSIGGAMIKIG